MVKQNVYNIQLIKNPLLKVQLIAITGNDAKEIINDIDAYIPNKHPNLTKEYIKWINKKINEQKKDSIKLSPFFKASDFV